jgi:hypothetical protein
MRRFGRAPVWVCCLLLLLTAAPGYGALTNTSQVVDGAGAWSSGGTYSNVNAVAQPGGVSISRNGSMINYAGFLNTVALRPALDTDGDGIINEYDPDNDGDDLEDSEELSGSEFSPTTVTDLNDADSDDDGMSDGEESVAGTDPLDVNALLAITAVTDLTNGTQISWLARSNKTYEVLWRTSLTNAGDYTSMDTVTVSAVAAGPWYVVTNAYDDLTHSTVSNGFYRILVQP